MNIQTWMYGFLSRRCVEARRGQFNFVYWYSLRSNKKIMHWLYCLNLSFLLLSNTLFFVLNFMQFKTHNFDPLISFYLFIFIFLTCGFEDIVQKMLSWFCPPKFLAVPCPSSQIQPVLFSEISFHAHTLWPPGARVGGGIYFLGTNSPSPSPRFFSVQSPHGIIDTLLNSVDVSKMTVLDIPPTAQTNFTSMIFLFCSKC